MRKNGAAAAPFSYIKDDRCRACVEKLAYDGTVWEFVFILVEIMYVFIFQDMLLKLLRNLKDRLMYTHLKIRVGKVFFRKKLLYRLLAK